MRLASTLMFDSVRYRLRYHDEWCPLVHRLLNLEGGEEQASSII